MATDLTWLLEGSSGTNVPTGSTTRPLATDSTTRAILVSTGTNGSITYDNAWSEPSGGTSVKFIPGNTSGGAVIRFPLPTLDLGTGAVRVYHNYPSETAEDRMFLGIRHSGGYIFQIYRRTDGSFRIMANGSPVATSSAGVLPTNSSVRWEVWWTLTSTTNYTINVAVYAGQSFTPLTGGTLTGTYAPANQTLASTAAQNIEIGSLNIATHTSYFDTVTTRDTASEIGPFGVEPDTWTYKRFARFG